MIKRDAYCSVSGAPHLFSKEYFFNHLSTILRDSEADLNTKEFKLMLASFSARLRKLRNNLQYTKEDVESSSRFVVLCPSSCSIIDDGMMKYYDSRHRRPTEYTESTIAEVFNISLGENPEYGEYDDIDGQTFFVNPDGNNLIVSYTSYIILKQAAPEVKPHVLYALAYGENRNPKTMGRVTGIDYGPLGANFTTARAFAYWPGICEGGSADFWGRLFSDEERADEDILHDAWRGPGNMWVFVRPDRFPIAETLSAPLLPNFPCPMAPIIQDANRMLMLSSLPPDVLLHICEFLPIRSIYAVITTCKYFRSLILPNVNPIARRRLIDDEPWYLPADPFELRPRAPKRNQGRKELHWRMKLNGEKEMSGQEEIEWWTEQWATGGISQEEMISKIPWFLYRKQCSKSMSMWNRKRLWGIAKQLDALARVQGLI